MARQGPKRDLNRELRYWKLLSQGIGTIEACRTDIGRTRACLL